MRWQRPRHAGKGLVRRRDDGFTLVELLVVIIIVGLLAAIAIPVYLSQREKAHDAAATADVAQLGKEVVTWFVDHEEPPVLDQDGRGYRFGGSLVARASDHVTLHASTTLTARNNWCVAVVNERGLASATGLRYSASEGFGPGLC